MNTNSIVTTAAPAHDNNISIFKHDNFGEIRVVERDGEPWFMAKGVCGALGLEDTNKALLVLDYDEKCEHEQYSGSGRKPIIISEAGLYSLILRSRKPEAKAFKRWVTHEVLPSIRKHGGYIHVTNDDDDFTILVKACTILKSANEKLEKKIAEDTPKVQLVEDYLSEGEEISMADLAKKLFHEGIDIGQNRLFKLLRDKGVLISRPGVTYNTPTQRYASRGWFKIIQPPASQMGKWKKQIRVTPKGVSAISKRMHELFGADL